MAFAKLDKLINKFDFKITDILYQVFQQQEIKDIIINLNHSQLRQGQDNEGKKLKTYAATGSDVYSRTTIVQKQLSGQPSNIVTLFDTGEFYETFDIIVSQAQAQIVANFNKGTENISDNLDTSNVLGLDETRKQILLEAIMPRMIQIIKIR